MIDFSNGPLVTPERVVVLSILCVGISGSREDLVPERGVAVRVRNTVWWLSAGEGERHARWPKTLTVLPTAPGPTLTTATRMERRTIRVTLR